MAHSRCFFELASRLPAHGAPEVSIVAPAQAHDATSRDNDSGTAAGQRLRVGRTYAGRAVTITMDDMVFHVLQNDVELVTHARQPDT
jgi:hypothetical protein